MKKYFLFFYLVVFLGLLGVISNPNGLLQKILQRKPFSIAFLDDLQSYTTDHVPTLFATTRWLKDKKEDKNIAFALNAGNVTSNNRIEEWQRASNAMAILDGIIPYALASGNEDLGPEGHAEDRSSHFNEYFGSERFQGKTWYGGNKDGKNQNSYYFFSAAGMEFMVLMLEFIPTDDTLKWANEIVAANSKRRVIVVTHAYMYHGNTRLDPTNHGQNYNMLGINFACCADDNTGEDIWNKFIKFHPNIFLVLSGHVPYEGGVGYLISKGDAGNDVHQILMDYKFSLYGWMKMLYFVPKENRVYVQADTPLREKDYTTYPELTAKNYFDTDFDFIKNSAHSFSFYYDMSR